jgi:hypothetical protein
MRLALICSIFLVAVGDAVPARRDCPEVQVLVDGAQVPKYYHEGTTYVEALKGQEYSIRITNPIGVRVAVALSVDGLNTIDARHTEARLGHKWVLEPYESVVISGWQTSSRHARRFFFTTEERSYGAWLGQTENLGVISAAFFRERIRRVQLPVPEQPAAPPGAESQRARNEGAPADAAAGSRSQRLEKAAPQALDGEYAATGIGERVRHDVQWIQMDLEDRPFTTVNLRYEFLPVLVRLGVLRPPTSTDPLARREKARGFSVDSYCPEP